MTQPLVVIIMGSKADLPHCQKIEAAARDFGLDVAMHVGSAHKTPLHTLQLIERYEKDARPRVYITVAGRSNALSGFVDGAVCSPVIACPPPSDAFAGADIYSSLRMPSGITPALVLEPANAALLAAKILALADTQVLEKVNAFQQKNASRILADDASLGN
mgnify:CR=1 FL=1